MTPTEVIPTETQSAEFEIRVLAATGVCGSGFLESSFERALAAAPHVIGCDAGSTDPGPLYLGAGRAAFPRAAVKRDLRLMLKGARRLNIPLVIGSAGTAGGDPHVEWLVSILLEVAEEERLACRLAVIRAEQDRVLLAERFRLGRISPLDNAPPLDADSITGCARIVGVMGAEPFMQALAGGADVIIAGRATDTAIFAALPLLRGVPEAIAWHAAKILECGAAAAEHRTTPDCMFAWLRADHFVVEPPNPDMRCTPQSVAAHALYENADPFLLAEPSGVLDLTASSYEAAGERGVRVEGSVFHQASRYTVKLEGASFVGYMSVLFGSVRDPLIIAQIDDWLARLETRVRERVTMVFADGETAPAYRLDVRVYGRNGTMGMLEPVDTVTAHELALVFEVTAASQEIANAIAGITRHQALHLPIPEWSGLITALACPYGYLERGPVFRFAMHHVIEPDDPLAMFPTEWCEVDCSSVVGRDR